jgi:hypothetical protein
MAREVSRNKGTTTASVTDLVTIMDRAPRAVYPPTRAWDQEAQVPGAGGTTGRTVTSRTAAW